MLSDALGEAGPVSATWYTRLEGSTKPNRHVLLRTCLYIYPIIYT